MRSSSLKRIIHHNEDRWAYTSAVQEGRHNQEERERVSIHREGKGGGKKIKGVTPVQKGA
jgi:hypothetical protein